MQWMLEKKKIAFDVAALMLLCVSFFIFFH